MNKTIGGGKLKVCFCALNKTAYGFGLPVKIARRPLKAEIRRSVGLVGTRGMQDPPSAPLGSQRVGLKPEAGWMQRNPLTEIVLNSLFSRCQGSSLRPEWPSLEGSDVGLTWIGHASFLIQAGGLNILVDPIWSRWVKGIKRMRHPGVELSALPEIDLVLVTHAHFDHLDRRTLRAVAAGQPVVVPREVGDLVHDLGFSVVQELSTWESVSFGPVRITLTPCRHWGARMLHDSHRGFGGYIIEVGGRVVYHCGDSAYFGGFEEIGRRFSVDVALLPIGAYDPPSLRSVHMNPEEALQACVALGAKQMVPMHYGTFRLSYEPMDEPPIRLLSAARVTGLEHRIAWMEEGAPAVF